MPLDASIPLSVKSVALKSPLQADQEVQEFRQKQQQAEIGAAELQAYQLKTHEAARSAQNERILNAAIASGLNPDGSFNLDQIGRAVTESGFGAKWPDIAKRFQDAQESSIKLRSSRITLMEAEANQVGAAAAAAEDAGNDPGVLLAHLAHNVANGTMDRSEFDGVLKRLQPDPSKEPTAEATAAVIRDMKAASAQQRKEAADLLTKKSVIANTEADNARQDAAAGRDVQRLALEGQRVAQAGRATSGGSGSVSAGDRKMAEAIMKNPKIYAGLTPTIKSRLVLPLTDLGFDFGPEGTAGKPSTGVQKRVLNFFNRAYQAAGELEKIEPEIAKMGYMGQKRMEIAPNFAQTQAAQSYTAAQRAFTEARLRKDSGAAIPEHEFVNDRQTYFVQPGDSAKTQADKKRARAAILASLAFESGAALHEFFGDEATEMVEQFKSQSKGQTAPARTTPAAPAPTSGVRRFNPATGKLE